MIDLEFVGILILQIEKGCFKFHFFVSIKLIKRAGSDPFETFYGEHTRKQCVS